MFVGGGLFGFLRGSDPFLVWGGVFWMCEGGLANGSKKAMTHSTIKTPEELNPHPLSASNRHKSTTQANGK